MPLHRGLPFQIEATEVQPTDKVWVVEVTGEACHTYEDYIALTGEYNSKVWVCSFTGRAGLTYKEAEESEEKLRPSLKQVRLSKTKEILKYLQKLSDHF
jgi:hypothetical protein